MIHRLTSGRWGEIVAPAIVPAARRIAAADPACRSAVRRDPDALPVAAAPGDDQAGRIVALSSTRRLSSCAVCWRSPAGRALRFLLPRACAAALGSSSPRSDSSFHAHRHLECFDRLVSVARSAVSLHPRSARASPSPHWSPRWLGRRWSRPAAADDPAIGDLGALVARYVLGITYMDFMAVLVIWYGDIPREEIWFVERERFPWPAACRRAFFADLIVSRAGSVAVASSQRSRPAAGGRRLRPCRTCLLRHLSDAPPAAGPRGLATAAVAIVVIGLGFFALPVSELHTMIHRAGDGKCPLKSTFNTSPNPPVSICASS